MRPRDTRSRVPAHLAEFRRADWPAVTLAESLAQWRRARAAFAAESGWPGGPAARLSQEFDARRAAHGIPTAAEVRHLAPRGETT